MTQFYQSQFQVDNAEFDLSNTGIDARASQCCAVSYQSYELRLQLQFLTVTVKNS